MLGPRHSRDDQPKRFCEVQAGRAFAERQKLGDAFVVAVREGTQFLGIISSEDMSEVFQVMGAALEGKQRRQPPAAPRDAGGANKPEAEQKNV